MLALGIFLAAWAAFTISAVAGGGAGLVMVPLLRVIVPIESVPAALSIGTAASASSRIAIFRRDICWKVVRGFVPTALPAAALGAWLLTRFEPAYVELLLACFLLANLPALLWRRDGMDGPVRPLDRRALPWLGAAAGLLSGFTGAVGLLFNNYYRRLGLSPREIVATRATNEVLLHLLKLVLYAAFGLLDRGALAAGALVGLAAIFASATVRHILPLLRERTFRRIGQWAMVGSGIAMFCLSGGQLMRLHRAWIEIVAPGGEAEARLHWRGRPRLALELENPPLPVIEWTIPFEALPDPIRKRALAAVPRSAMTQIERVDGLRGRSYEIYFVRDGRPAKIELDP